MTAYGRGGRGTIPGHSRNFYFTAAFRSALGPIHQLVDLLVAVSRSVKLSELEADH